MIEEVVRINLVIVGIVVAGTFLFSEEGERFLRALGMATILGAISLVFWLVVIAVMVGTSA